MVNIFNGGSTSSVGAKRVLEILLWLGMESFCSLSLKSYGQLMDLVEYGGGGCRGLLGIAKRRDGNGWKAFCDELRKVTPYF